MGTNGDYWGLNFMGTTNKTIDVIPQVSKSSHYLPIPQSTVFLGRVLNNYLESDLPSLLRAINIEKRCHEVKVFGALPKKYRTLYP